MRIFSKISVFIKYVAYMLPIFFIYAVLILYLILPPKTYSKEEQRYYTQWPIFQIEKVFNGDYEAKVEQYFSDQFPFREFWIQVSQLLMK